jgi:hypothetical protein
MSYIPDDPNDPFNLFVKETTGLDLVAIRPDPDRAKFATCEISWTGDDPTPVPVVTLILRFPPANPEEHNEEILNTILKGAIHELEQTATHGEFSFTIRGI